MRVALLFLAACGFSAHTGGDAIVDGTTGGGNEPGGEPTSNNELMPVTHRLDVASGKVVNGPHANFPALVQLTAPWLKSASAGGNVASAMGYDIAFSLDAAGTMKLDHEVERYGSANGELVAWVKVPSLTGATQIFVHAGDASITTSQENKAAVWSASYAAVYHLTDATDATTQNNGSNNGTGAASGRIEGARTFNGTNNAIDAGSNASVDDVFAGGGTAEAWFTATSYGGSGLGRLFDKGPATTVFSMCDGNLSNSLLFGHTFSSGAGNWCTPQNSLTTNQWTYVAVTYNADSSANVPTMYINGAAQSLGLTSSPSGNTVSDGGGTLTIGDRSSGSRAFAGRIDELRFSRTTRSAGWIQTTFANESDPTTFWVVN